MESTPPKINAVSYIAMLKEKNIRTGFLEGKQHDSLANETEKIGLWLRAMFEWDTRMGGVTKNCWTCGCARSTFRPARSDSRQERPKMTRAGR